MSTPEKLPISCYIRTLNEERNLERCLTAIAGLVEEVVIVDSGSTDGTLEIARRHGAIIVEQAWLGWGRQKRVGEKACRYEWLLDLDADEVISEELSKSIRAEFSDGVPDNRVVFAMALTTVSPTGRVFRLSGVSWRRKLYNRKTMHMPDHETWDQSQVPRSVRVQRMSGPLLHHAYDSFETLLHKQNRMSSSSARTKPRSMNLFHYLRLFLGFPAYFLRYFLIRRWFFAGVDGFCVAMIGAMGSTLRDIKRFENSRSKKTGAL